MENICSELSNWILPTHLTYYDPPLTAVFSRTQPASRQSTLGLASRTDNLENRSALAPRTNRVAALATRARKGVAVARGYGPHAVRTPRQVMMQLLVTEWRLLVVSLMYCSVLYARAAFIFNGTTAAASSSTTYSAPAIFPDFFCLHMMCLFVLYNFCYYFVPVFWLLA